MKNVMKKSVKGISKIAGKTGLIITSLLLYARSCYAGVQDSVIATGTQNLVTDLTNWLLILAPALSVLLVGYYLLRKSAGDEMDAKRWDSRIKITLICCVGVIVASGLINLVIGYYK